MGEWGGRKEDPRARKFAIVPGGGQKKRGQDGGTKQQAGTIRKSVIGIQCEDQSGLKPL